MNFRYTFKKAERISEQREIDYLFSQNTSFAVYPLRVIYTLQKPLSGADVAVLISVSKKKIRKAVHRNRIKRLIRESYRINKHSLIEFVKEKEIGLLVAFLFQDNKLCTYKEIDEALQKSIELLKAKLS